MKYLVRFEQLFESLEKSRKFNTLMNEMRHWFNDKIAQIFSNEKLISAYPDFEDINVLDYENKKILFLPKNRRPNGKPQEIKPGRLAQSILNKILPKFDYIETVGELRINDDDYKSKCSHLLIVPEKIFTREQYELFHFHSKTIVPFEMNVSMNQRETILSLKPKLINLKLKVEKVQIFSFLKSSLTKPFGEEVEGIVFYFDLKDPDKKITSKTWLNKLTGGRNLRLNVKPMQIKPVIVTAREIELFATRFEALTTEKNELQRVRGEEIRFWYNIENSIKVEDSYLVSSCMSYSNKQKFLDIYTKNSAVELLILKNDEGKLLARALLWKLTHSFDGSQYFMDRVYFAHPSQEEIFFKWAIENKIPYYKNGLNWKGNSRVARFSMMVQLEESNFENYPFLDTLYILNRKTKQLMNPEYFDEYKLKSAETISLRSGGGWVA